MNSQTILMCVVSLIFGMLLANMLKSVCGCKVVEGQGDGDPMRTDNLSNTCQSTENYRSQLGVRPCVGCDEKLL